MLAPMNKAAPTFMQRLVGLVTSTPRAKPFSEMGVSGTPIYGGYVQTREKSSGWMGAQRYITISDMAVNASIVAAGVHYFLNLIARPSWTAQPADESAKAKELAEFVDAVLHDMRRPWPRVVRRAGTYRFFGFGVQEWTAKRRPDGKIGLASVEPRPQHTIERWALDPSGKVEGVFQRDPSTGQELGIPRGKIMYLVEDAISDSPEGVGIFRHLAEPWERLKVYMELEARAFERDLRGIPVGRVPYTLLNAAVKAGEIDAAKAASMSRMLEDFVQLQVRQSNTAITLDSVPYYSQAADGSKVAGMPQWGLELLQGAAQGVEAIAAAITRTQMEMARILTCEHLLMGADGSGNRALSEDKSRNLYLVANAVLADIAEAATHDLVEPIWLLNSFPDELKPRLEAEDVAFQDADTVAATLAKMAQAGAVLAPDDPVIEDVRALMGVSPPAPIPPELVGMKGPEDNEDGGEVKDEPSADADDAEIEEGGLEKAFDPNQPRHPPGSPEGGQWVSSRGSVEVFHGTTDNVIESILAGGIRAQPGVDNFAFVARAGGESAVFVTNSQKNALAYARAAQNGFAERYWDAHFEEAEAIQEALRRKYGSVKSQEFGGPVPAAEAYPFLNKVPGLPSIAVVHARIPKAEWAKFKHDRESLAPSKYGRRIKPEWIKSIKVRKPGSKLTSIFQKELDNGEIYFVMLFVEEGGLSKRAAQAGREAVAQLRGLGKAAGRKTLYVKRRLLNPEDVRAWAAAQGIASTLRPDDMHVTVAFSREPVDWSKIELETDAVVVLDDGVEKRAVHQFPPRSTPNGALVLKFESPELRARWQYFRDAGASWDFPEYQPHVTITYSVPQADVGAIEPYRGPLIFGPEEASEVNDDWAGELVEEPTSMISVEDRWVPQGG